MTIRSIRGSHTPEAVASSTTITLDTPPAENTVIFVLLEREGTEAWTPPEGFTLIGTPVSPRSDATLYYQAAWKRATASEPTTYTFSRSVTKKVGAASIEYAGVLQTADPIAYYRNTQGQTSYGIWAGSAYYVEATFQHSAEIALISGAIVPAIEQPVFPEHRWEPEYYVPYVAGQGYNNPKYFIQHINAIDMGSPTTTHVTIIGPLADSAIAISINVLPEKENRVNGGTIRDTQAIGVITR